MSSTELTDRQRQLRDEFIDNRGYWSPFWEGLLTSDEDFFESYLRFSSVPWRSGPLDPKVKELVYIAVDAAATHLFVPGIRQHIKQALALGATADEIMEVLELTSTLGIHACNIGVPILVEELEAAGQPLSLELDERQEALKADFTEKRGYWHPFWHEILALDPDFFESYIHFSSVPWVSGTLEPKVKELIYTAFDVSATHLYEPGLRLHIKNAIGYGATKEEVLEVMELASVIGIHSCVVGVPMLLEELAAAEGTAA
ncbi:MAG TPA: carboxymuconolactone decarboxylase family protein [Solirubrobacteraceae bacterium]|jgi:alkylhydroperoxidase/carboxymuconolactone decarboxylase family protein YurZ|nr:carboxymuconolactone decarboxylase family protein [Solirubrobacteraceae bacterium]